MSSSVIDKYLVKKKKDLTFYAKELESIITIDTNTLWDTKQKFGDFVKEVIDYYVEHYYFDNNVHRDNPIEYSNDNINSVLLSIIEYCKASNQQNVLQEKKNETFLMAVIICTACYLDISSNVVDGDYKDTKEKFKYLLQHLQKTNILKIYLNDKKVINRLFDKLKENNGKEEKFFNEFIMDNSYNEYKLYTKDPDYYLVSYHYHIDGLENYDPKLVTEINDEFKDKYFNISCDLLSIELLKEYISNNEVNNYLIPVTKAGIKKISAFKVFDDERLKKQVKLIIDYNDKDGYTSYINKIKDMGLEVIYDYQEVNEVTANAFLRNMTVIVKEEFLKKNEDKLYNWKNHGINFIVKNIEEDVK